MSYTRTGDDAQCYVLIELKHFRGPWWHRWVPLNKGASDDLLKASKKYNDSMQVRACLRAYVCVCVCGCAYLSVCLCVHVCVSVRAV
jgi:hypothetical protein